MRVEKRYPALEALLARRPVRRLLDVLNGEGEETRLVGGAVRNVLLDKAANDFDCGTTASPQEVERRATQAGLHYIPTGIEHGTITVRVEGHSFEVTTLREDIETDGRRARVRFGRDFEQDALRRDFTINALSLGADGALYDYTGGLADLAEGKVRFIGDPVTRIREDALRILRFFRFHAAYAKGPPDVAALSAAIRERASLALLSAERVRTEILKLLAARRVVETITTMADHGFLALTLSIVGDRGRLERVVTAGGDPLARLGALAVMSLEDPDHLRERLRLSNQEYRRLQEFSRVQTFLKSRAAQINVSLMRALVAEHGVSTVSDALSSVLGEPRPRLLEGALQSLDQFRLGEEEVPVLPIKAIDFVTRGVPQGPRLGQLLSVAKQAWLEAGCPMDATTVETLVQGALAQEAAR